MAEPYNEFDNSYTQNRELSWLKFNERVMQEAEDETVPLFERLKFISIFTSNLDEFFMIRVGSLYDLSFLEQHIDNKTGQTPAQQLQAIFDALPSLYQERDAIYLELEQKLRQAGVACLKMDELQGKEQKYIARYFQEQILPVLSPQIVDFFRPFPHLENKALNIVATLQEKKETCFGIIPVPALLPRMVFLPNSLRYVLIEEIILEYAQAIFEMYNVLNKTVVSVTRNADISPEDEGFEIDEDYRHLMKKMLKKRARLAPVRLEVRQAIDEGMQAYLCDRLHLQPNQVFVSQCPLKMDYVYALESKLPPHLVGELLYQPFDPVDPVLVGRNGSLLRKVEQQDILLSYPYEQMEPFLRLLKEASDDPEVISIKITIYRLANKSKLVEYLCAAAENGKDVVVLMELRARFDERNNINWAEILEEAGCSVFYGFDHYKVHSKLCLITRRGRSNEVEYITQVGTGNYNEKTAKLYTDLCLITADQEIGQDAASFFKNMALSNLYGSYHSLLVAPVSLQNHLIALMDQEIEKVKRGGEGSILIKVNSITERALIDKLAEASQAGVKIRMIVRGICCILPGVPDKTDNITVHSIVGRFLEHSRVYCFGQGAEMQVYIASADMMTRNTRRRVEIACPVLQLDLKERIYQMLIIQLQDTVKARELMADGCYHRLPEAAEPAVCAQEFFMDAAKRQAEKRRQQALAAAEDAPQQPREGLEQDKGSHGWLQRLWKK